MFGAIGFDSNGLIDATALATFSAGSELTVKVWYDQAGGGFDLEQSNDAYLPTIYDGSAVTTSTSGKPCVRITRSALAGPGEWLQTNPVSLSTAGDMDVFLVLHGPLTSGGDRYFWNGQGGPTTSGARWGIAYNTNLYVQQPGPATSTGISSVPVPNNLQFIFNAQFNPSGNINTLVGNGTEFGTYTSSTTYRTDPYNVALGARVGGTEGYNSYDISEVIHLPDYGVSNNESINLNINSYYQFTNLPYYSSGFLADYTGASAAYSVRKLSNTAIKYMRVRRAVSPFDEQDIGFTAGGDLDEAAIVAFGGSDVLTVSAWYDQSGQSRHATQITPSRQPQIYDGAAVITDNGKPCVEFDGANDFLDTSFIWTDYADSSYFAVLQNVGATLNADKRIVAFGNTSTNTPMWAPIQTSNTTSTCSYLRGDTVGAQVFQANSSSAGFGLMSVHIDSSGYDSYKNGGNNISINVSWGTYTLNTFALGAVVRTAPIAFYDGKLQEVIVFDNNKESNRTAIETNINTYYDVYTMYNSDPATSGFLFDYPDASTAYSVRQLNNNATVSMRVMRAVAPFDEQDIGFVNGDLDEAAIVAFGGSDALTVSAWYDQSGNQNHARQIGPNQQPQIYNGASVIDQNGKPGVDFYNTTARYLQYTPISPTDYTVSYVGTLNGNSRNSIVGLRGTGTNNTEFIRTSFLKINVASSGGSFQSGYGTIASGLNPYSIIVSSASSTATVYRNNTSIASSTQTPSVRTDTIGGTDTGDAGIHSETVIWESELNSSDRAAVYSNQDTYYNIP